MNTYIKKISPPLKYIVIFLLASLTGCANSFPTDSPILATATPLINTPIGTHYLPSETPSRTSTPTSISDFYDLYPTPVFKINGLYFYQFSIAPTGDLWLDADNGDERNMYNISPEGDIQEFPLYGGSDLLVTNSFVWELGVPLLPEKPVLYKRQLDGALLEEYSLPLWMMMDNNGELLQNGLYQLHKDLDGRILLSGSSGIWQVIDQYGNFSPLRMFGFECGQSLCNIGGLVSGNPTKQAVLSIDTKNIDFSTEGDYIFVNILGIAEDGTIYIEVIEVAYERRVSVQHYDLSGNLIESASIPTSILDFDPKGIVYNAIRSEEGTKVFQVEFHSP